MGTWKNRPQGYTVKEPKGKAMVIPYVDLQNVFVELDEPYRAIALLSYDCACRAIEILSLKAENITPRHIKLYQPKVKCYKVLSLAEFPWIADRLRNTAIPASGFVFPGSGKSGHLTYNAYHKHLRRAYGLCGIPYEGYGCATSHSMRRSSATHLYDAGVDPRAIMLLTGHKTLSSLEQYLGINRSVAIASIQSARLMITKS